MAAGRASKVPHPGGWPVRAACAAHHARHAATRRAAVASALGSALAHALATTLAFAATAALATTLSTAASLALDASLALAAYPKLATTPEPALLASPAAHGRSARLQQRSARLGDPPRAVRAGGLCECRDNLRGEAAPPSSGTQTRGAGRLLTPRLDPALPGGGVGHGLLLHLRPRDELGLRLRRVHDHLRRLHPQLRLRLHVGRGGAGRVRRLVRHVHGLAGLRRQRPVRGRRVRGAHAPLALALAAAALALVATLRTPVAAAASVSTAATASAFATTTASSPTTLTTPTTTADNSDVATATAAARSLPALDLSAPRGGTTATGAARGGGRGSGHLVGISRRSFGGAWRHDWCCPALVPRRRSLSSPPPKAHAQGGKETACLRQRANSGARSPHG
jgi:hypothetical protein